MSITALTYLGGYIPALPFSIIAAFILASLVEIPSYRKTGFLVTAAIVMFAAYSVIYNVTLWSNHV